MKAGIVEIPHLVVVTKSDLGAAASRARADVEGAMGLAEGGEAVEVQSLSAARGEGIDELVAALDRRWQMLSSSDRLSRQRQAQARRWLADAVRQRFGREGLKRAGEVSLAGGESPFAKLAEIARRLT